MSALTVQQDEDLCAANCMQVFQQLPHDTCYLMHCCLVILKQFHWLQQLLSET